MYKNNFNNKEGYKGNNQLKPLNYQIKWTEDMIVEKAKCQLDIKHFIENYIKISLVDAETGIGAFKLRGYQERIINAFDNNRFVILKIGRQTGKSTVTIGYALYQLLFNQNYNIYVLAQNADMSKELLNKFKLAYENLPFWLQEGVKRWDQHTIELENGSRIMAKATSKNSVRGRTANLIICDEFAFVEEGMANDFFSAVWPTITSGKTTKFFILSTPNGYNLYHKLWTKAELGEIEFVPISVHWSEVPGRDEEWKKREISVMGQELFDREHECKFESSSLSLINGEKIAELIHNSKEYVAQDGNLFLHEKPEPNKNYILIADTAKGVGLDYSSFSIIDITNIPYKQVAVFRDNNISPLVFPEVIHQTSKNYNDAYVLVEQNEYGSQVAYALFNDLENENVLWSETTTNRKQRIIYNNDGKGLPGIKTTEYVKKVGCTNLKALIEHDKLQILNYDTISELSKFIKIKDSYGASKGANDDIVMTLILFAWLTTQDFFKDLEQDVGKEIRKMYENEVLNIFDNMGIIREIEEEEWVDDEDLQDLKNGWRKVEEIPLENIIHMFF